MFFGLISEIMTDDEPPIMIYVLLSITCDNPFSFVFLTIGNQGTIVRHCLGLANDNENHIIKKLQQSLLGEVNL